MFEDHDVGHPVHLRELFTVERCHQLPGSGLGGDEVLRQCHCGVTPDVTVRDKEERKISLEQASGGRFVCGRASEAKREGNV